ncbi:MAG: hypothetical protein NVSMB64_21360 [Candidatus Velthaea sp.]
MGADRGLLVVALQALLMGGVRSFGDDPAVAACTQRTLATAAALDYVLMLATDTAGVRIAHDDAERAMRDGFARAVDDGIALVRAIASIGEPDAGAFAREGLRTLRSAIDGESLADDTRTFAMIALATDLA